MLQGQWVWLRDTSHWTEGTPDTQILSSWTDVSMNWGLQGGGLPGGTDGQKKQLEFGERGWADREPGNARPEPVIDLHLTMLILYFSFSKFFNK